jgi:hypothetical protein
MGIVRDTWRAVLVLIVGVLLLEAAGLRRQEPAAPPSVVTNWQPAPPYVPTPMVIQQQQQPERPLRRVASAIMEFGDSLIGVVR